MLRDALAHPYRGLRLLGMLEGLSYLVLLGVGMPLKYLAGFALGVRIFGPVHGGLFVAYLAYLYRALDRGMSLSKVTFGFVASLLPFGWLAFDPVLRRALEAEEAAETADAAVA